MKLRCVVCGGPAFDCECWREGALKAEAARAHAKAAHARRCGDGVAVRIWEMHAAAAERLADVVRRAVQRPLW